LSGFDVSLRAALECQAESFLFWTAPKFSSTEIPGIATRSISIHAYKRNCLFDAGDRITILVDIVFFNIERYVGIRLYGGAEQMGVTKEQAVQNRERILEAAERLFREKGVDAVGLAELMKEAGFTMGGFYNHFASKEALVSEVVGKAMDEGTLQLEAAIAQSQRIGADPLTRHIKWYLSPAQRDDIDCGCAIAGFAGDISHLSDAARASYAEALEQLINLIAQMALENDPKLTREEARARAVSLYSHMVGSLLLSRAVSASEPALADEILKHGRSSLLGGLSQSCAKDSSLKPSGSPGLRGRRIPKS
jgi:TetR/AcrR family transcriptional regulator, transcriptional repressor for nem operon